MSSQPTRNCDVNETKPPAISECQTCQTPILGNPPVTNFDSDSTKKTPDDCQSKKNCRLPKIGSPPVTNFEREKSDKKGTADTVCPDVKIKCNIKPCQNRPDHSVDSYHPDIRVQNYLYHENNRLYCHGIFNKAGKRVWDVERNNRPNICFWKKSEASNREKAKILAEKKYEKWVENHRKRNEAYSSNPLRPFFTSQVLKNTPFFDECARYPRVRVFIKNPC